MSAAPARRRLHRPEWSPVRERHLRLIPGGRADAAMAPGEAFCCGCDWTPAGRVDLADAATRHVAETSHAVIYR